jgi:hypothetical protein
MLRPQDVLLACKLFSLGESEWIFSRLAGSLAISASEAHAASERCRAAGVLGTPRGKLTVARRKFFELCTVVVPQVYYAVRGSVELGIPTSIYAEPLKGMFVSDLKRVIPLIWPYESGTIKGESLLPLYPTVPRAIQHDEALYKLLALIDVVRAGEAKERQMAVDMLEKMILGDGRRMVENSHLMGSRVSIETQYKGKKP